MSLVQSVKANFGGGSNVTPSLTGVTGGNSLLFFSQGANITDVVPTDSSGQTWTKLHFDSFFGVQWCSVCCYYLLNANAGTHNITWTGSVADWGSYELLEWTTLSAVDVVGTASHVNGTNTGLTASSITTTNASDAVFAYIAQGYNGSSNVGISDPPTGYTSIYAQQDSTVSAPCEIAYKEVSSTGSQTASWSWGSIGTDAIGIIVSFKKSAGGGGTSIAPGVGAVTFSGPAPTVTRTANQSLTPNQGAVTFTGQVPTVARTANQALTPGVGAVSFTGYAPTVSQSSGTTINPGVGAVTFTGYAPSISQPQALTPGVGAVSLTGYAPTVAQPQAVNPGVVAVSFTGYAASVAQTANQSLVPDVGAVAFTGYGPVVAQSANQFLAPGVGALTLTGYVPTVTVASASVSLVPGVGALTLTGWAPDVAQSSFGGGNAWDKERKKRRAQIQAEVNRRNLEIIKAELQAEMVETVEEIALVPYDDDEEALMLLL